LSAKTVANIFSRSVVSLSAAAAAAHAGHVQIDCPGCQQFFAGGSEVSAYLLDGKQQKQQSSKNRIPSVIDVNKNKNKRVGKRELTNQ